MCKPHTSNAAPYIQYGLVFVTGAKPEFELSIGNTRTTVTGSDAVGTNTWTHVAGTYDGSNMKVYVNGQLKGTRAVTGAINTNTMPIYIGQNGNTDGFFAGKLDEVRIYNRALSGSEIQSAMNQAQPVGYRRMARVEVSRSVTAFPNPYTDKVFFGFNLAKGGMVTLAVYNAAGEKVETIFTGQLPAGLRQLEWSPKVKGTGLYFYTLETVNGLAGGKIVINR
jgi:hypothetical protein